ncbi:MAG: hypothetical protein HW421_1466 [Ignavibacteria bacterium]|nr:hypothetical protein [Ignavibacteria bacterium]
MKKLNIIFPVAILVILIVSLTAKDITEFRVFAIKGNLQVQKPGASGWNSLKAGMELASNDVVKVSQNGYVSLSYIKGGIVELVEGTYKVKDLVKQAGSKKSNISGRLTNYIVGELGGATNLAGKKTKNLSDVPGAVERGLPTMNKANEIGISFPRKTSLISPNVTLTWQPVEGVEKYEFYLYDKFDREMLMKTTPKSELTLDLINDIKLNRDSNYFWVVKASDKPQFSSEKASIRLLSDNKIASLNDTLKVLEEEISGLESSLKNVILGKFYENHELAVDAKKYYQAAVQLSPDIEEYKQVLNNFIAKNH